MFIVTDDESTKLLFDNESVLKNLSILASTLNKKHSSITYHSVIRNVDYGVILVARIYTNYYLADTMKKILPAAKREILFGDLTY